MRTQWNCLSWALPTEAVPSLAINSHVERIVHLTHATGADRRGNFVGAEAVLRFQAHLSKACQLVTSTSGASTPGSRMVRTRKRLPSGATS
jgi:hypothetical protein